MSNVFKVEIVNPEKSFLSKEDVTEVVIPAFEGEMGILKDHISLVTFLRPGFIEAKIENNIEKFYVEEGTVEFFKNNLSILTSSIFNVKDMDKGQIEEILKQAENDSNNSKINDQQKYLVDQKIDVLKSIN